MRGDLRGAGEDGLAVGNIVQSVDGCQRFRPDVADGQPADIGGARPASIALVTAAATVRAVPSRCRTPSRPAAAGAFAPAPGTSATHAPGIRDEPRACLSINTLCEGARSG
jgi:hypothetical protein